MNWEQCDRLYAVTLILLASICMGNSAGSKPGSGENWRGLLGGLDACRRGESVTGYVGALF